MKPNATTEHRLVLERDYAAPPETVFHCWTDPDHLARWFIPNAAYSCGFAEVDLRVGGQYRIGMRNHEKNETHVVGGVYREIAPHVRLVFTWAWESPVQPPDETLVTVSFQPTGEGTRLVLVHERFPTAEMRNAHDQGWSGCLNKLREVV